MADLQRRLLLVVVPLLVGGCPGCRTGTPALAPRPLGGLLIRCDPGDAMVYVDDRLEGSVSNLQRRGLVLSEGFHRVELRKDGYFSHFAEVTVVEGVRQQLEVRLRKEPF